jgi:hypothetical protein
MDDRAYYSSAPYTPSRNPRMDTDALEITLGTARHACCRQLSNKNTVSYPAGTLNKTPEGRQTTFETRLAMQRELDAGRSQLKTSERQADEFRRQASTAREEACDPTQNHSYCVLYFTLFDLLYLSGSCCYLIVHMRHRAPISAPRTSGCKMSITP